jgi:hypothetical protein
MKQRVWRVSQCLRSMAVLGQYCVWMLINRPPERFERPKRQHNQSDRRQFHTPSKHPENQSPMQIF